MGNFKVLIPQPIAEEGMELLRQNGCELIVADNTSEERLVELVKDCSAILVRTASITRRIIESANKLEIIARHGVGLDNVDIDAASENNVFVSNAPSANINSVAEHVVGMMLAVSRHIVKADNALRQGKFEVRNIYIGSELKEKTLGLVGLGNIGKLVAEKCALGFGMKVIAYDPYVKNIEQPYIELVPTLEEMMAQSDFISLHVPYNRALHHLINKELLEKMKPSAYIVNAARGGLIDEEALYRLLSDKKIAGAALDCFEEEPTPLEHPFWGLDNVVVTPHMAAHTEEAMIKMAVDPANEIIRVKNNLDPVVCVNQKALKNMSF